MAAMSHLLSLDLQPTAVLCSNDLTAIGVMHSLFEANWQVPAQLSVVGFDDVHIAQFMLPPLTTVRMGCAEIAESAFNTLRGRIESLPERATDAIETELIVRQTTARPRAGVPATVKTKRSPGKQVRRAASERARSSRSPQYRM